MVLSFITGFADKESPSKIFPISRKRSSSLFPAPLSDINRQERAAAFDLGCGLSLETR
jgi:hypothetical protein